MEENPNYNPETEASVLGCLLIDTQKIEKVKEQLDYKDFSVRAHQIIYRAMMAIHERNEAVDVLTLADSLNKTGYLDVVGGAAYLTELTNHVPTAAHLMTYVKIVKEDSAKRQIIKAAHNIVKGAGGTLDEAIAKVKEQVGEVNKLNSGHNKFQLTSMADHIEAAKERYENWGKMFGLSTGFPSIDQLTLGMPGGELIIVAGETSRGKTLLSMNIANFVAKNGGRVLFVTLEMTYAELTSRYMFLNGGADTEEFLTVAANTVFQHNDELDWKDIDGLIANAKQQLDVDLVVVDHLHYFTRELQNVAEDLGRITKEFSKNAKRHNIPIILISHVRKIGQGEDLNENALRGSSYIGQDADIVLFVARDPETNEMGVLMTKNRNRGKLSDRTKEWAGRSEKDINTIYLEFNNTKLKDTWTPPAPEPLPPAVQQIFPGAEVIKTK
jgi:replicative DNA helicase